MSNDVSHHPGPPTEAVPHGVHISHQCLNRFGTRLCTFRCFARVEVIRCPAMAIIRFHLSAELYGGDVM